MMVAPSTTADTSEITITSRSAATRGITFLASAVLFPAARQGEAMNLINAKYGSEPGLKAYTHVSDQFGPFATQTTTGHGERSALHSGRSVDD